MLATTPRLKELAQLFLKLGCIGFGGPQAHIAMQNDEVVTRRQWLSNEEFSEGLAICEMLPGPASTQLGIYIGYVRAGYLGALVSGTCFIAPAFLILLVLSWLYFQFQSVPQVGFLFLGISPVVTAIILGFCWKLGRRTLRDVAGIAIALITLLAMALANINVFLLFLVAAAVGMVVYRPTPPAASAWFLPAWPSLATFLPPGLATVPAEVLTLSSLWGLERIQAYFLPLTTFFLRIGSFIFGGGLVIIPLLEHDVVDRLHWLTRTEFINGVALGQLTPGPVVLTAAFIGFKVAGVLGALTATVAIFFPSFAFIMLASPMLTRLRKSPWIRAALRGVTSAVVGAIAAAGIPIAQTALVQPTLLESGIALGIAIAALIALLRYKTPTWQLVPAGAAIGLAVGLLLSV